MPKQKAQLTPILEKTFPNKSDVVQFSVVNINGWTDMMVNGEKLNGTSVGAGILGEKATVILIPQAQFLCGLFAQHQHNVVVVGGLFENQKL